METRLTAGGALAMLILAGSAVAAQPDDARGRYTLSPVDDGFIRLDRETGAVSLCTRKSGDWVCDAVTDKTASSNDLGKLEAENRALRDRVKALQESLESGPVAKDAPAGGNRPEVTMQLPSEEEIDKAFDYVEGIFKKFRERLKKYETPPGEVPETQPQGDKSTGTL